MGSRRVTTEHRASMLLNIILSLLPLLTHSSPTLSGVGNLSRFQLAVQHCCHSKTSKTPHRCFELNEFSGVNFVASPCRFLMTLEKTLNAVEPSDRMVSSDARPRPRPMKIEKNESAAGLIVKKSAAPDERKEKVMSKFQSAVQNCCSNRNSNTPYRCFEKNGVEGVNFVERPCRFLQSLRNIIEEDSE